MQRMHGTLEPDRVFVQSCSGMLDDPFMPSGCVRIMRLDMVIPESEGSWSRKKWRDPGF